MIVPKYQGRSWRCRFTCTRLSADCLGQPTEVHAPEFGGALRYPSGHTQFFVTIGSSYLGENQECLIFLWKPFPMPAYNIGQVYMIEADGAVYPISRSIKYKWTSKDSLVAAVTSAIKANVNR